MKNRRPQSDDDKLTAYFRECIQIGVRAYFHAAGVHFDTLSEHDQREAVRCMGEAIIAVSKVEP